MNIALTAQRIPIKDAPKVGTLTYTFRVDIDEKTCTGCGICVMQCPSRILDMAVKEATQLSPSACRVACPAGNDLCAAIKMVTEQDSFEQAWRIMTRTNPMPAVTGRVCPHPCESQCNRTHLDDPVNVNQFERFIGDYGIEQKLAFVKERQEGEGKVAVVGGGPSGMSCAYHLAKAGYQVTLFEANEKIGGMLRYGIPRYRLPGDVLDRELQRIIDLGVNVRCSIRLGKDIKLSRLRKDFNAVYLALGAQSNMSLGVKGEKALNSFNALDFLKAVAERKTVDIGKKVTIIGGGNVAIDSARSALRCGAQEVTIVCLEQRYEMPAWDFEIEEAITEGIRIINGYGPSKISKINDRITEIVFKRCTSVFDDCGCFCPSYDKNDRITVASDSLVIAIGQRPDCSCLADKDGITTLKTGHVEIRDAVTLATTVPGIFAGGDAIAIPGCGTVSGAIGMGRTAALAIDAYVQGRALAVPDVAEIRGHSIPEGRYYKVLPRKNALVLPPVRRLAGVDEEVNLPLHADQVLEEAERCLVCGTGKVSYTGSQCDEVFNIACHNCHNCVSACPEHAIRFTYYTRTRNGEWS